MGVPVNMQHMFQQSLVLLSVHQQSGGHSSCMQILVRTVHTVQQTVDFHRYSFWLVVARIDGNDISSWPFSVGLLVKIVHFLGSLHWPRGAGDLGIGGVSYLELLILYEQWAGERLVVESAVPFGRRYGWASNFSVGCSYWSRH